MTEGARPSPASAEGLAVGEAAQLAYVLETRLQPALEAAESAVQEAERALAEARERLERAESGRHTGYASDPLIFMRQSVDEELEALGRKTNEKRVRASYRFLLDRSVELAAAEVARFHDDQNALQRELDEGLEACRTSERRAVQALESAREMHDRVRAAERSARQGLRVLLEKLGREPS